MFCLVFSRSNSFDSLTLFLTCILFSVSKTRNDSSQLNPPIRMVQIVSHWFSTFPDLLSSSPLVCKDISKLPLVHSSSSTSDPNPTLQSLLPGLMQWCILSPLYPNPTGSPKDTHTKSGNSPNASFKKPMDTLVKSLSVDDMQTLMTSFHANLLSNILSISKPPPWQLCDDEITSLVTNLLAYYSERKQQEGREGSMAEKMDECVERLAQLLQLSLSSKLLNLRPGEWVSVC